MAFNRTRYNAQETVKGQTQMAIWCILNLAIYIYMLLKKKKICAEKISTAGVKGGNKSRENLDQQNT